MRHLSAALLLIAAACGKPADTAAPPVETGTPATTPPTEPATCTTWLDADGDGFGADGTDEQTVCSPVPDGRSLQDGDCNDADASVNPSAPEVCDGADQDCDELIDEDAVDADTWYSDADRDGFGDDSAWTTSCDQPPDTTDAGGDCDDTNADVNPLADDVEVTLICDGLDNDCDGSTDGGWRVPEDQSNLQVAVNSAPEGGVVCVAAGTHDGPLNTGGRAITVLGAGSADTFVQGVGGRVVTIAAGEGPDTVLQGLSIRGGEAEEGAGVYVDGANPTLIDLVIEDNHCVTPGSVGQCWGAGLWVGHTDLTIDGLVVRDNTQEATSCFGAGVLVTDGTLTLRDADIYDNVQVDGHTRAFLYGAGISAFNGDLVLEGGKIHDNVQDYDRVADDSGSLEGAGVHVDGDLIATSVEITDNQQSFVGGTSVNAYGAGLHVSGGSAELNDVTVAYNTVQLDPATTGAAYGAGVRVLAGSLFATDLDVIGNTVNGSGLYSSYGALYLKSSSVELTRVLVADNELTALGSISEGGGIFSEANELYANNVVLANNSIGGGSINGGAGLWFRDSALDLSFFDVVGNRCTTACDGVGMQLYYGDSVTLDNSLFVDNQRAGSSGGAYDSEFGVTSLTVRYSGFYDNGSSAYGSLAAPAGADGNLFVDPLYTDTTAPEGALWDLALSGSSPAVDAGDPDVLDVDATRADMGSRGGPNGAW